MQKKPKCLLVRKKIIKFPFYIIAIISFMAIILIPYITNPSIKEVEAEKTPEVAPIETEKKPIFEENGKATYYSPGPKGKILTLTAAHKTLPRGTIIRVEAVNRPDYQPIEVEITDRLPNIDKNRGIVIDLDKKAAIAMNPKFIKAGKIQVKITVIEL